MRFDHVYVPYGAYWTTPFCKWQGSFSPLHPIPFAAEVTAAAFQARGLHPDEFDTLYLGMTVPAKGAFYGAPWLAGLLGADWTTGPTIAQACATSARVMATAAQEVELRGSSADSALLCVTTDRTSNGPHIVYPQPHAPGAKPDFEDWVWDNFNCDPWALNAMIETAENVAREEKITVEEQHEVALIRYEQYQAALADDASFHRRFMIAPIQVKPDGRKVVATVTGDEGVYPTSPESLAKLRPVLSEGTVTYGGQTYPADGNAGLVVSDREAARRLSRRPEVEVRLLSFAQARARRGFMPEANLPASQAALEEAGVSVADLAVIKTHNPFAVNDITLARGLGVQVGDMNNFGCSLIWGHPQAPTGMRLVIELIEELEMRGGGVGLFTGCAAGDTAAALVVEVGGAA